MKCNGLKTGYSHLPSQPPGPPAGDGYCAQKAGWGTDHVGQGRCKLHGGATPIKHGRYSVIERESIRDLADHFLDDDAPLDVLPELAQVRALLTDYVNRYAEIVDALCEWNRLESEAARADKRRARLAQIPKLDDAIYYLKTAAKIAQDEKKLQLQNAISRKDLLRIFTEQRRIIEHETDPDTASRILDGFRSIRLA
ncbi:MAG: hypothetical protein GVY12_01945 [Bacteroidetes bacterium]|jgi:hypothetical protein|nr:hypothetical protein [Bacteroidota bacterium]